MSTLVALAHVAACGKLHAACLENGSTPGTSGGGVGVGRRNVVSPRDASITAVRNVLRDQFPMLITNYRRAIKGKMLLLLHILSGFFHSRSFTRDSTKVLPFL